MSQAGKVLHVYMEVRSVPEDGGKMLEQEDSGSGNLGLPCLEFFPDFQKNFAHCSPNRSPDHSPITERRSGCSNRSVTPSKSPSSSRHAISFQLQNPDATGSPTQYQRQDVVDDNFAELLRLISPEGSSADLQSSMGSSHLSGKKSYKERGISPNFTTSGRLSVPNTPTCNRKSPQHRSAGDEEGKTSVVTFGYIEKSNVHSIGSRSSSVCQTDLENILNRPKALQKRLSDPMWYSSHQVQGDNNYPYQLHSPRGSTCMQRTPLNGIARDATHAEFDTFGSPELKRCLDYRPERFSPTMPRAYQSHRCRSLEASPILPRNALTLPSKNKTCNLDREVFHGSLNGLPRSPASEHLCGHAAFSSYIVPSESVCQHGPHRIQSLTEDQSPRLPRKYHSTLPAGRSTDIPNYLQANKPHSSDQVKFDYQGSRNTHVRSSQHSINGVCECSRRNQTKLPHCMGRNSDSLNLSPGKGIVSPSSNVETAYKLAMEATRLSPNFKNHLTTSPCPSQAESHRTLLRESQLTLQRCHSPEITQMKNHRNEWKIEQRTQPGPRQGSLSPLRSHRGLSSPTSPALPARLHEAAASYSSDLDSGLQISSSSKNPSALDQYQNPQKTQDFRQSGVDSRKFDSLCDRPFGTYSSQYNLTTPSRQEPSGRNFNDKSFQNLFQRSFTTEEIQGQWRAAGNESQSSSGVTGSITDSSQQFPETSSQSSYDTVDTGSAIQTDNSLVSTPTTRSQKIARAKWEFLFGGCKAEEDHRGKDTPSTTLPARKPPPSTPSPSSQHLMPPDQTKGWNSKGHRLSQHKVRQIELELVTPNLRGSSPKTGIIRRTIKYSETDLDAVPLRCYRETDLDEVMRAEAEEVEADSAFSSNRSILEISSFSPADVSPKPWNGGGKGRPEEEEEEDNEQVEGGGEVVSWASVRMLGDKQRQRAAKEEDEVFSLLLKGPLEASSDANSSLKSPISVSSPRLSESNLDSFSRHFENIMESHRAKGTSYSSLDSVDLLTSGSTSVFTFDLPTLTPEIQSQICDSAKQIIELSFAPLVHPDSATAATTETSRSESTLNASGGGIQNGGKDDSSPTIRTRSEKDSWRRTNAKDGVRKANSAPSLHSSPRERPVHPPLELLYPQADVAERLALGGSDDALPNGTSADLQAAKRLAKRLYHLDGFKKSDVARHLSKNNEFSQKVAEEYLSNFNFSGLTIDQALRSFLNRFALIGETQERERVLAHFSRRFGECNADTTEDSVHTLTCAVMLLNSDLHGNNVGKRMSCNQFITNLEGLNNGKDFPKDLLKTLYSSIKNEKLQWTIDEEEVRKTMEQADSRTDSASHTMKRLGSSGNPLMGVAQQADGEVYKSGFLVRKVHADPDGKRTPRGKRSWKSFYAMLKGLVLYLQKDEYRSERELTDEDLKNSVSIHHSLALRAVDYRKRPNVFYLRTADWRVFLLQAPNAEQMQSWITRINVIAAMFSAPPFPAAIGSQKRFSRPLLPGSNTKLSQEEQVKSHENRFRAVSSEHTEIQTSAADIKGLKGRELEEHKQRLEYLEFEKTRYGTYAMLLRAKFSGGDQDLETFESRLFDDGGLQRAHSSPVLPQDTANKEKIRGTKTSKSLKVLSSTSTSSTTKTTGLEGEDGKKNGNNTESEPRKQSIKQEEAA